jgi:hypothetical protein
MLDGSLRAKANLTKSCVAVYRRDDGARIREYRPPAEVFSPASLATLRGITLTWLHPTEFVSADNWKDLSIGHVSDVVNVESDYVTSDVVVSSATEIAKVDSGDAGDLSCGYDCVLLDTPGVTDSGEIYDAVQTQIVYNHVALLPKGSGRLGRDVSLRTDAAELDYDEQSNESALMTIHRIDGKDFTAGSAEHISAVDAKIAALVSQVSDAEKRVDVADKARAAAELKASPEAIRKAAAGRASLLTEAAARKIKLDGKKLDEGTDDEILLSILKDAHPGLDFGALALSHEQLMMLLQQTAGKAGSKPDAAPGDKPDAMPGDAPKPPADPPPGPPRTDGIDAARGGGSGPLNAPKPTKTEADILREKREARNSAKGSSR